MKVNFLPCKIYVLRHTYNDSDRPCDCLSCEIISFRKYRVVLELNAKIYEILARNWAYEKRSNFEFIRDFSFKFNMVTLKPIST